MTKINQEEYKFLKNLDDKWKWIARDRENLIHGGELQAYAEKPQKRANVMWSNGRGSEKLSVGGLFQFIQWEDEEPYNIQELIEEYEGEEGKYEMLLSDFLVRLEESGIDTSRIVIEESEETEVKNIKRRIDHEVKADSIDGEGHIHRRGLFNLLDEYEVLSPEWIEDESMSVLDTFNRHRLAVPVEKLEKILVPKQEEITEEQAKDVLREKGYAIARMYDDDKKTVLPYDFYRQVLLDHGYLVIEKPSIPQFVADWLEKYRDYWELYVSMEEAMNYKRFDGRTRESDAQSEEMKHWLLDADNQELYVRAWLDGYTVEETEYRRVLKVGEMYFLGGGDSQGNFVVELTDNRRLAHVFDDEEEANNMQNEIGGRVEELEE